MTTATPTGDTGTTDPTIAIGLRALGQLVAFGGRDHRSQQRELLAPGADASSSWGQVRTRMTPIRALRIATRGARR